MLTTGVAKINPDYDPAEVFSQEIIITAPERICSYDETRVKMDCTKPCKGKGDRFIKGSGKEDDGEVIVTKSSKTATVVCGRLGDGRFLPVYMVFASGEEHDVKWAPEISEPIIVHNILDKNGEPISWRYASNVKRSMTDEFCAGYIETMIYPALGYPSHRDSHPGQQGVIVCDGVGTHLGANVLLTTVRLGMEILLITPNLSYILQGEDTVNFKELKAEWRIQKYKASNELNKDRKTDLVPIQSLGFEHLMQCFKPAWDKAFGSAMRDKRGDGSSRARSPSTAMHFGKREDFLRRKG